MIYLIGVDHKLQDGHSQPNSDNFIQYVRIFIESHKIELLSEEWSTEITNNRGESKLRIFENITNYYQFDLSKSEQLEIGVKSPGEIINELGGSISPLGFNANFDQIKYEQRSREEARKREPGWLKKLQPHLVDNPEVLLICGSSHLSCCNPDGMFGFDQLLKKEGFNIEILACFFCKKEGKWGHE